MTSLACVAALLLAAGGVSTTARAQGAPHEAQAAAPAPSLYAVTAVEPPELAPGAKSVLGAAYLNEAERTALRLKHGAWDNTDLQSPVFGARAALLLGNYADPSLRDPGAAAEDRAEALLETGELEQAIAAIDGAASLRAARIRAASLIMLGRPKDAAAALKPLVTRLVNETLDDAGELVEGVRGLELLARLSPEIVNAELGGAGREADFRAMMAMLARARDELDPLDYRPYLAEAELLAARDNAPEAGKALDRALELNPKAAESWALLGRLAAEGWDFENALGAAERIDVNAGGPTWQAAAIRANVALRMNDPEQADRFLETALARFPAQRELLALHVAAAGLRFDDALIATRLAAYEKLSPGSGEAYFQLGRIMSDARQYEEAEAALSQASKREPAWAEPAIELGLVLVQAGRDAEAREALEHGASLDPFNVRVANSLTLVKELGTYAHVESDHFIIRYKPGPDEILAREMLGPMEMNYARVTGSLPGGIDFKPPGKTVIELYPDHHWFSVRITGMRRVHTIAAATGPVIAMETPRIGAGHSIGVYDWSRVLRHEFTHTVTLARTKNRLPHWFTEAAAVYLEDSPREASRCRMLAEALLGDGLFDFNEINIAFVRPRRPTDRGLAYAQGHWMYEYMVERYGKQAPLKLMDRYATGEREADAMKAEFGSTREQFLEDFKTWARTQVVAWGLLPQEGTPTVPELLAKEAGGAGPEERKPPTDEQIMRWLEAYPAHPQVLALAVARELESRSGRPDEAMRDLLNRFASAAPMEENPHRLLARLDLDRNDRVAAAPHLEFLDAREQYDPSYAMELARTYAQTGDLTRAREKAERAVRIAPFDPGARELAATIALMRKDLAEARRHLAALVVIEPDREQHRRRLEALDKRAQ